MATQQIPGWSRPEVGIGLIVYKETMNYVMEGCNERIALTNIIYIRDMSLRNAFVGEENIFGVRRYLKVKLYS